MSKRAKWTLAAAGAAAILITALLYAQSRAAAPSTARQAASAQTDRIRLQATRENISNTIEVKGKSSYVDETWIYAPFASDVKSWEVKDGAQVGEGDVLFRLDDTELRSSIALKKANLRKEQIERKLGDVGARLAAANEEGDLGDEEQVFGRYADKEQKQAEAELAEVQTELDEQALELESAKLAKAAFKSPRAGIFLFEGTKEPQRVGVDEPLGKVVDTSKLQLLSTVGEYDVFRIKPGMDVQVTADALPQSQLKGKVERVSKFAESGSDPAAFEVVISLEAKPEMIAGLSLVGSIRTDSKQNVVVVPTLAILREDNKPYVYVERDGNVEKQPVEIGLETPDKTEIVSGVREGDTVVLQ